MQHPASVGPYGVPGNSDSLHGLIPRGAIIMWSGLLSEIPVGWALCDGTLGTPNLVGRFVRGVNTATTNPGTTGGADSHLHAVSATHSHEIPFQFNGTVARNTTASIATGSTVASQKDWGLSTETNNRARQKTDAVSPGNTDYADGRPAFYELAFIIKL